MVKLIEYRFRIKDFFKIKLLIWKFLKKKLIYTMFVSSLLQPNKYNFLLSNHHQQYMIVIIIIVSRYQLIHLVIIIGRQLPPPVVVMMLILPLRLKLKLGLVKVQLFLLLFYNNKLLYNNKFAKQADQHRSDNKFAGKQSTKYK